MLERVVCSFLTKTGQISKKESDVSQDGLCRSDILVWSDNYGASRLRCPPEDRQSTGEGLVCMSVGDLHIPRVNQSGGREAARSCISDVLASEAIAMLSRRC